MQGVGVLSEEEKYTSFHHPPTFAHKNADMVSASVGGEDFARPLFGE
jgi:hypothetical protein